MQISSDSHGVSRLMSQSSFYYLGATHWSVQLSSFHSNRKRISPFLPLSPWLKEGRKGQINPLICDFKELGRNGNSGDWECDLHGKPVKTPASPQAFMPQALEEQPHGSGFLLEHGANKQTPEETDGSSVGKGQSVNFQAQGVGARLRIWATCLETQYCPEYQLPHRLSSFAAGRAGGARQVSDMKLSVYLLINSKKCALDLLEREIVLPGWRTWESSR